MAQSLILVADVPGLGQPGDVCKVKDGYARNYLLPNRLALRATPDAIKRFEHQKEKLAAEREKQLARSQSMAEKISKIGLVFERPVGPGGRLFGSVTPLDIVTEMGRHQTSIEKKSVLMNGAIKSLGDHTVRVRLHSKVVVDIPVKVTAIEDKKKTEIDAQVMEDENNFGQEEEY